MPFVGKENTFLPQFFFFASESLLLTQQLSSVVMVVNDDLQSYYESVLWLAVADRPALSVYIVSMDLTRSHNLQLRLQHYLQRAPDRLHYLLPLSLTDVTYSLISF